MKKTIFLCALFLFLISNENKVTIRAFEEEKIENSYSISSGKNHTLLKSNNGDIFAWGSWGDVSLTSNIESINRIYPTNITSLFSLSSDDEIDKVFSGEQHSFVLSKNHRVYTFGFDGQGQLGDGGEIYQEGDLKYSSQLKKEPIEITQQFVLDNNDYIIKLSGGANFSLALSNLGQIFSFGENNHGQLGDESILTYQTSPINITSKFSLEENEKIIDIKTGAAHALALSDFGKLYVWGNNNFGQLGNNNPGIDIYIPTLLNTNSEKVIKIACGSFHSYYLTSINHLYGFGFNGYGQLADKKVILNSGNDKYIPYEMSINFNLDSQEEIIDIYSGHYFGIARTSLNNLYSFGQNNNGQLGNFSNISSSTPIKITNNFPLASNDNILFVGMGEKHVVAVSNNQEIYAWGDNGQHQLGYSVNLDHYWKPLDITAKFPPIIRFSMLGSSVYSNSYSITIEAYYINNLALDNISYIFTHSADIVPADSENWQNIHNGDIITLQEKEGTFYLWVKVENVNQEIYYKVSKAFLLDSINPSLYVSRYNDEILENNCIVSEAVYVKASDNNSNVKLMYRMNLENEFKLLEQNEHIFVSDGRYEIKAIDIASNTSESFCFIIDTIAPLIKQIDTHQIETFEYNTTRKNVRITASEILAGYIYQDDGYITALEKESDIFELTLKKGENKIVLVDLSGKQSEVYIINYTPSFFEDSELMLYVFGIVASIILILLLFTYIIKTRKKLKFEENI